MDERLAVISIIVSDRALAAQVNELLHGFGDRVVGRMGLPYPKRGVHIITVVIDAPQNDIAALSGKLGRLPGASVKVTYARE